MKLNISIIVALLMLLCFSATTVFATTPPVDDSASVKADDFEEVDSAEQVFTGRIEVIAPDHVELVMPNDRGEFDILRVFQAKDIEMVLKVCPNGTKVCQITGVLWEADGEIQDISYVENP